MNYQSSHNPPITTGTQQFPYRGHLIEVKRYVSGGSINLFVSIDGERFNLAAFHDLRIALELAKEHVDKLL
jgi:hypothetical protein